MYHRDVTLGKLLSILANLSNNAQQPNYKIIDSIAYYHFNARRPLLAVDCL